MNTTENNKLIAEFMKLGYTQDPRESTAMFYTRNNIDYKVEFLQYHTSWDWLMPVVEKIENTSQIGTGDLCKVYISNHNVPSDNFYYCNIFGSEDHQFNGEDKESKIKSVYKAVVEFIKWYNENK